MAFYTKLNKEDKQKLIIVWEKLANKYANFNFKATETTEKQHDYIFELTKLLDRRDASTLIALLQILNDREDDIIIAPELLRGVDYVISERNYTYFSCESVPDEIMNKHDCRIEELYSKKEPIEDDQHYCTGTHQYLIRNNDGDLIFFNRKRGMGKVRGCE